jgi:hypothetical protein
MNSVKLVTICAIVCFGLAGVASAVVVDLAANENGWAGLTYFERYDPDPSTGTGVFDPFVRIQGDVNKVGVERGYNTDGAIEFETKPSPHTHSIKLGDILVVGGQLELLLDIDQNNNEEGKYLSLDVMKIYLADSDDLTDYWDAAFGAPVYDLGDNWVPKNPSWDDNKYFYLYSEFGGNVGCSANDGPEEWAVTIPEPATIVLLGLGFMSLIRRKHAV